MQKAKPNDPKDSEFCLYYDFRAAVSRSMDISICDAVNRGGGVTARKITATSENGIAKLGEWFHRENRRIGFPANRVVGLLAGFVESAAPPQSPIGGYFRLWGSHCRRSVG
jgi:hypothetical protein